MVGTERVAIMVFGAIIAIAGLILLFRGGGGESRNSIKAFGAEFDVSSSGVIVFLVGAGIFLAPMFLGGAPSPEPERVAAGSPPSPPRSTQGPERSAPGSSATQVLRPAAEPPKPAVQEDVGEVEPNDGFASATPVELGSTIHGQLTRNDVDFFKFRTSSHYKHDVKLKLDMDNLNAQVTMRVFDSEKGIEMDKFLGGSVFTGNFLAKPNSEYFIQLENRPDWNSTAYTLVLTEN